MRIKKKFRIEDRVHKTLCLDKEAWSNPQMAYYNINTFL